MSKAIRLFSLIALLLIYLAPMTAHAAPPACDDEDLFWAAASVARSGVALEPRAHYQLVDAPYTVDYWQHRGKYLTHVIIVKRNNTVVWDATRINAEPITWRTCHPGNGWKNYILSY